MWDRKRRLGPCLLTMFLTDLFSLNFIFSALLHFISLTSVLLPVEQSSNIFNPSSTRKKVENETMSLLLEIKSPST